MSGGRAESCLCLTSYVLPAQEPLSPLVSMHSQKASAGPTDQIAKAKICAAGLAVIFSTPLSLCNATRYLLRLGEEPKGH